MGVSAVSVPQGIATALTAAGEKSNVDFDYLVQTAIRESSLNPTAKAPTSSATGLFQFLDATWLQVMKEEGPRLGYQQYANAVTVDGDGDYTVKDKAMRAEILKLREDPQVSADLAAAFTKANGEYLQEKFGRMPSGGELYIAHFMGPQGAERLFKAGLSDPDQSAAALFPRQARANRSIFYDSEGARSVKEVYQILVAKHDAATSAGTTEVTADPAFVVQQLANGGTSRWSEDVVAPRFGPDDMGFTSMFRTETESDASPVSPLSISTISPLVYSNPAPLAYPTSAQLGSSTGSPLTAIAAATGAAAATGTVADPLPAPAPLEPMDLMAFTSAPSETEDAAPAEDETALPVEDTGLPRPRVLITRPVPDGENPFLLPSGL